MTPTREELIDDLVRARTAAGDAFLHLRVVTSGPMHDELALAYHIAEAWRAYHALGEALRQTGTEPPQPTEGA